MPSILDSKSASRIFPGQSQSCTITRAAVGTPGGTKKLLKAGVQKMPFCTDFCAKTFIPPLSVKTQKLIPEAIPFAVSTRPQDQDRPDWGSEIQTAQFENACRYADKKEAQALQQGRLQYKDGKPALLRDFSDRFNAQWTRFFKSFKAIGKRDRTENLYGPKPTAILFAGSTFAVGARAPLVVAGEIAGLAGAGKVALAAASPLASAPVILTTAVASSISAVDLALGRNAAVKSLIRMKADAMAYQHDPDNASADQAKAYLAFMGAAKKIPALNQDARSERIRTDLAAVRDGASNPAGLVVGSSAYLGAAAGTIATVVSSALSAVAGVFNMLTAGADIYHGHHELKKARSDKQLAKLNLSRIDRHHEKSSAAGESQHPVLRQVERAYHSNQLRKKRQASREGHFAVNRLIKGGLHLGIGSAGTAVAIALAVGVSIPTAGIVLPVLAALVATAFVAGTAAKNFYKWKAEHTSKRRQRQAQILIATHSRRELTMMVATSQMRQIGLSRPESSARQNSRLAQIRYRDVDVAANEYLSLHLLALQLADMANGVGYSEEGIHEEGQLVCGMLKKIGMCDLELRAMHIAVQALPIDDRVEFIKKSIAPSFGVNFRTLASGREAPIAPAAYLDACAVAFREETRRIPGGGDSIDTHYSRIAKNFFERIDPDQFIAAIDQSGGEIPPATEAVTSQEWTTIRDFSNWAKARQQIQFLQFSSLQAGNEQVEELLSIEGMTSGAVKRFQNFVEAYAAAGDDKRAEMLANTPPRSFVYAWWVASRNDPGLASRFPWGPAIDALTRRMQQPKNLGHQNAT